ncbi:STAS-like domain-containing protein [Acidovorax sp. Q11]
MVVIRIQEHAPQASTYADGQAIFDLLKPRLAQGEEVTLSFNGILAVPSAFINAAIVQLVEHVPLTQVRQQLRIADSTRAINNLIRTRLEFVERSAGDTTYAH